MNKKIIKVQGEDNYGNTDARFIPLVKLLWGGSLK
jgi:hypothetical protein